MFYGIALLSLFQKVRFRLVKAHQQKRQALLLVFFAVRDTVTSKREHVGSCERIHPRPPAEYRISPYGKGNESV